MKKKSEKKLGAPGMITAVQFRHLHKLCIATRGTFNAKKADLLTEKRAAEIIKELVVLKRT
jgi:hypothetical protein